MYTQYVVNYLQAGGAKTNALDIPDVNIKTIIAPEILLNPLGQLEHIPSINNDNLSKNPTIATGAQMMKECKLTMTIEEGKKFIDFVNASIKELKDNLRENIKELVENQNKIYKEYRDSVVLGDAGNNLSVYQYFETVSDRVARSKEDIKKVDDEFKKNIKELIDSYNNDKKGRHPPIKENSWMVKTQNAIMSKLKFKKVKVARETKTMPQNLTGIITVDSKKIKCGIVSVHLSKGIISVTYETTKGESTKHHDADISFRNLCIINPNTVQQKDAQIGGDMDI